MGRWLSDGREGGEGGYEVRMALNSGIIGICGV
jgi:hypothetical protein